MALADGYVSKHIRICFTIAFFFTCNGHKSYSDKPKSPSLALSAENNALHITSSHFRTRTSYQSSTRAALIAFHLGYAENQLLLLRSSVEGKDKTDVCAEASPMSEVWSFDRTLWIWRLVIPNSALLVGSLDGAQLCEDTRCHGF
ncbi:unnamed protein product [Enterobius vermicularis]|uniref:WD_REPEATS_REGION domain-containing protein n=1 Tax=Enterobius vermicularis TaxID=51028 RepID=A0A0N4VBZ8_ENTVE|nr:unnamed protein product [Enterobius vermicularis]